MNIAGLSRKDLAFESDPRRQQEIRLRPLANNIYRGVFGDIGIQRYENQDNYMLDKEFAVDVKVSFPSGMILIGQEKFLSCEFAKYQSVTVEYEQNQHTGECGDWFKLGVQFYFVGYATEFEEQFDPWVLLNWPAVVLATHNKKITWRTNKNKNGRAKASFRYTNMLNIPGNCIVASSFD